MGKKPYLPLKPLPPRRDKFIFCYDANNGERIFDFMVQGNKIYFFNDHRRVMVDYTFDYDEKIRTLSVGDKLLKGFLHLTGKMTTKDYHTGKTKTAILDMPKVKITTNLSFQLGSSYDKSIVSDFFFTGYPVNQGKICDIVFLDTELTGDYI
ncbi:MAG: hypothetical protein LUC37_00950 [Prevotella sp.]|nr:hypothetical protein [Prevotella sp.]